MNEETYLLLKNVKNILFFISLLLLLFVCVSSLYMYYIWKDSEESNKLSSEYLEKWEKKIDDLYDKNSEIIAKNIESLPSDKFEKETAHIRLRSNEQVENYHEYLEYKKKHKAFAVSDDGYAFSWRGNRVSAEVARDDAMEDCNKYTKDNGPKCYIYSINGIVQIDESN